MSTYYVMIDQVQAQRLKIMFDVDFRQGPCIMVAIDRIREEAQGIYEVVGKQEDEVFKTLLAIELIRGGFHAAVNLSNKHKDSNKLWHRIITESIAYYNAYVYMSPEEREIFFEYINKPLEYNAYKFWVVHDPLITQCSIISEH